MHNKRIFYLLLALILGFGLFLTLAATYSQTIGMVTPPQTYPRTAQVQAHQFDASGLNFTLSTPQLTLTDQGAVHIPGLDSQTQEPGAPLLPIYVTLIALPPEAQLSVDVETKNIASSNVDSVVSVPRPPNSNGEIGRVASSSAVSISPDSAYATLPTLVDAPDPNIYEKNNFFPELIYEVSDPYYYRDLRLVEFRLYPVRYNPVTKNLLQAQTLSVSIRFNGSQLAGLHPVQATNDTPIQALADLIINYDQAKAWRSLPADLINSAASNFPSEVAETYKIEVNQDGIYELSGAELAAAGMNISAVDPATIEMMVRGQSVAYQFDGDGDTVFEADEIIRFYGWAFDGPRTEKQFVNNNVFWLWAGGTQTHIITTTNQTSFPVVTATIATVTKEPETLFTTTYTDNWENFPNEPDSWYWDLTKQDSIDPITKTYQIDLPFPATINGTETATYTVELLSREKTAQPLDYVYTVTTYLNDYPTWGQATWENEQDINITNTLPATALVSNINDIHLVFSSNNTLAEIYLNRITVEYLRELAATDNQLIFSDESGGQRRFQISGYTVDDADKILVWNITNPDNPTQIQISASDIGGSGPFTYSIGSNHPASSKFIATTMTNTLTVAGLSQYLPVDLEPAGGGADWIAISHADFMIPANDLAVHRAAFSNMTTHVVDIEDVTNQYGYGLPLPSAIRDYLANSLATWTPAPGYVTIFGAATYNPRNLDCQHSSCPGGAAWDKDQATFVVTDLVYEDQFQGLIPSDQPIVMLIGDDLTADMAIGRIPAETAEEAAATVAKIILYEQSQANSETWHQNMLFIADNADVGGNFFAENESTIDLLPDYLNIDHYYLVDGTQVETDALRDMMYLDINGPGVAILNYRGHGSAAWWASPNILSSDNTNFWQNGANPTVILSADCLDGNFAFPGITALSRTFLTLQSGSTPVGSAAHWSSTGLGYTTEHSALHRSFYNGLYQQNLTSIGDAVNYAKQIYDLAGFHESEIYSFLLQGDPAMQLFSIRYNVYLPAIVR